MTFHKAEADILVPDGVPEAQALARTTHLAIGAHQDDLEIMAADGILRCFGRQDRWFAGVTCTDGAGSPRAGVYADYSNEQMQDVRREEQRTAARIGRFAAILQLEYASAEVKDPDDHRLEDDLAAILEAAQPEILYTHNPADKHPTHVAVTLATVAAARRLPPDKRPRAFYGCEVWRDLDWMPDNEKVALDVSGSDGLAAALIGVYDSQVAGGKRYDLASLGRRRANATYFASHGVDTAEELTFAMDLTPLLKDDQLALADHVCGFIDRFRKDIAASLGSP